jgi:hypothetical protein
MSNTWSSLIARLGLSAVVILGAIWGYTYYVGNSIQSDTWVVDKLLTWVSNSIENISEEDISFHNAFDINGQLKVTQNEEEIFSWKVWLVWVELYANDTALKQRISADNIFFESNIKGESEIFDYNDLDIIAHEENLYLSIWKWWDKLFSYLEWIFEGNWYKNTQDINTTTKLLKNISEVISQWKYAHINNGTPIKKVFENLSENTWMPQLFIAMVTSNPNEYLEKNKIYDEIKKELYNDKWIDSLFILSENQIHPDKQTYLLNKGMCKNITPVILEVMKQSGKLEEWDAGKLLGECEKNITGINPILSMFTQIYKEGDIEQWNYDFVIAQWNAIDLKATYRNHILQTWKIFIQEPQNNTILLSLSWDKFWVKESIFKVLVKEEWTDISGEVINGSGEINIDTNNNGLKIKGELKFQDYKLVNIDIVGDSEIMWINSTFAAKWNYLLWNINFLTKSQNKEVAKLELDYTNNSYKLDFESINLDVNSLYKWKEFIFAVSEKGIDWIIENETKIVYDDGKISGFLKNENVEVNLKWEIVSIEEFVIEMDIDDNREKIEIHVNAEKENDTWVNYLAYWRVAKEKIFNFTAHKNTWEKEWSKISTFEAVLEIPSEKINAELKTEQIEKKPVKKYNIPEKVEKIKINISQIMTLPNFHQIWKASAPEIAVIWTTLWAVWGTVAYISLQWYEQEARNSRRMSDLSNLVSLIELSITKWDITLEDLVIIDEQLSQDTVIRIWWNKIIEWWNYFIWDINYEALEYKKEIFELEGEEYKIAVYKEWNRKQYQLLTFLEEGNKKSKVLVKWNYFPRILKRYEFIHIKNTGKEEVEKNTEEEIVNTLQIEIEEWHDLVRWDNTNLWIILNVNDNIVTLEKDIKPGVSKIYMLWNDSTTLFVKNKKVLENWQIIEK